LDAFYRTSLFANEIMLMPYYIASLNIRNTLLGPPPGRYEAFEGLSFVNALTLPKHANPTLHRTQYPAETHQTPATDPDQR
jgi:predicted helicase